MFMNDLIIKLDALIIEKLNAKTPVQKPMKDSRNSTRAPYTETASLDSDNIFLFEADEDYEHEGVLNTTFDISTITEEGLYYIGQNIKGITELNVLDRYTLQIKKGKLFDWENDKLIAQLTIELDSIAFAQAKVKKV